jgi:putative salt-induced outer membrane protein
VIVKKSMLAVGLLAMLPAIRAAADWSGQGEFGLVIASGNTETENINARFSIARETEKWKHELRLGALGASSDGDTTAERYEFAAQSNYKLNERSYLFGALRYEDDRFSGFEYQGTLTGGYGRIFIDNGVTTLNAEAGLGYRLFEPVDTGDSEGDIVARGLLNYSRLLTETTTFANRFLVEAGADNTFFENEASLAAQVVGALAMKLAFIWRRNSDVPAGTKKTDKLTTVSLVYSFD